MSEKLLNNIKNSTTVLNITNKLLLRDLYLKKFNKKYHKIKKILNLLDNNIHLQLGGATTDQTLSNSITTFNEHKKTPAQINILNQMSTQIDQRIRSSLDTPNNNDAFIRILDKETVTGKTIQNESTGIGISDELGISYNTITDLINFVEGLLKEHDKLVSAHANSQKTAEMASENLSSLQLSYNQQDEQIQQLNQEKIKLNKNIEFLIAYITQVKNSAHAVNSTNYSRIESLIPRLEKLTEASTPSSPLSSSLSSTLSSTVASTAASTVV